MTDNPHFQTLDSWKTARRWVPFRPLEPRRLQGRRLESLSVHVRDHKRRELDPLDRTLEAHFDGFVFTQAQKRSVEQARDAALEVSYGQSSHAGAIAGHPARVFELGPVPPPDDIDGRSPAVVTWHDEDIFYLLASDTLEAIALVKIARALYG